MMIRPRMHRQNPQPVVCCSMHHIALLSRCVGTCAHCCLQPHLHCVVAGRSKTAFYVLNDPLIRMNHTSTSRHLHTASSTTPACFTTRSTVATLETPGLQAASALRKLGQLLLRKRKCANSPVATIVYSGRRIHKPRTDDCRGRLPYEHMSSTSITRPVKLLPRSSLRLSFSLTRASTCRPQDMSFLRDLTHRAQLRLCRRLCSAFFVVIRAHCNFRASTTWLLALDKAFSMTIQAHNHAGNNNNTASTGGPPCITAAVSRFTNGALEVAQAKRAPHNCNWTNVNFMHTYDCTTAG